MDNRNKLITFLFSFSIMNAQGGNYIKNIEWNVEIMPFSKFTNFITEENSLNPNNRIAKLYCAEYALHLRPSLKYENKKIVFSAHPRLKINNYKDLSVYFQELKIEYRINDKAQIMLGRYVKELGSSLFVNPGNPFFIDADRINPKIEIKPMDFLQINYYPSKNFALSFLANLYRGEANIYQYPLFDFKRNYALYFDYYISSGHIGSIFSISENLKTHLGYYGQKTISDAIIIWLEGAIDYRPDRFYAVEGHEHNYLKHDVINGSRNDKYFFSNLFGFSFSLKSGTTFYIEYFHNGKGFNNQDITLQNAIKASTNEYHFDATKILSDRNLGRIINSGMIFPMKNYIFSQITHNELFNKMNCSLRYFYCLDDKGAQLSSLLEWDLSNNLQLFSVGLFNIGNKQTNFKQLVNYQTMIGMAINY
ncbi:MAG: hypothetical protein LBQ22_00345 [Bacteroidales bacterium]|nr:hypothetical protein [Bacteroidales bacterium]